MARDPKIPMPTPPTSVSPSAEPISTETPSRNTYAKTNGQERTCNILIV
jgi:hypothetical protein